MPSYNGIGCSEPRATRDAPSASMRSLRAANELPVAGGLAPTAGATGVCREDDRPMLRGGCVATREGTLPKSAACGNKGEKEKCKGKQSTNTHTHTNTSTHALQTAPEAARGNTKRNDPQQGHTRPTPLTNAAFANSSGRSGSGGPLRPENEMDRWWTSGGGGAVTAPRGYTQKESYTLSHALEHQARSHSYNALHTQAAATA